MSDTIFALATPPGRGAVAVIRVSGVEAGEMLAALAGPLPPPREATLRTLKTTDGVLLDRALVLWFPAPASFTGENCAEFHLHGGAAVVDGVTLMLAAAGARLAEPGEFTRRAFQNGKLDLSQAEAIADLVDAETAAQARQALDQLGGDLARRYAEWRGALIHALSLLEAAVDFPEDDAAAQLVRSAEPGLRELHRELRVALLDSDRGRAVRDGYKIALIGAPNAGKSSLINRLARRDVSIVHDKPGTTRDVIDAPMTLAGYKVIVSDTAGLRESDDAVEAEGARRASSAADGAGLRLWIVDGSAGSGLWRSAATSIRHGDFCVVNKADLAAGSDRAEVRSHADQLGLAVVEVSATTGPLEPLIDLIESHIITALDGSDFPAATRLRHAELLREASANVDRAIGRLDDPELAAEDLRLAARAMERITGNIGVEDVLDRVFSTFCIGK